MTTDPNDSDDDFPWDAPIHVVNPMPIVERADQVAEGHTAIPVDWIQDERLSLGARGLLIEIVARGGEWDVTPEMLAEREGEEDVEVIRGYFAELEREGYIAPES